MIDTNALDPATVLLMALYDYRCALWQAQQHGIRPPAPPALSADALVDAYGAAMNRYGAQYMTFAAWYALQQTPQPPRRYAVVGVCEVVSGGGE